MGFFSRLVFGSLRRWLAPLERLPSPDVYVSEGSSELEGEECGMRNLAFVLRNSEQQEETL